MVSDQAKRKGAWPIYVAFAVAIFGILAMLVVDHGPWSHPHAKTAALSDHQMTTAQAAHDAGAVVVPTEPNSVIEPEPPGPKQVEPPTPKP
jgi:hypothetical protein